MNVRWLVEDYAHSQDLSPLYATLEAHDVPYDKLPKLSTSGDIRALLGRYHERDCVLFYGSLDTAGAIYKKGPWTPGVYYNIDAYNCTSYYPALGKHLLNAEYVMLPFGELERRKEELFAWVGEDRKIFLRPDVGYKTFTGSVIPKVKFEHEIGLMALSPKITERSLVIAARPRPIQQEWRFVVCDGKIVTGSQYMLNGVVRAEGTYTDDAAAFAEEMANLYQPERVFVLDVCRSEGEHKVMEVGCFSCAGLYNCDLGEVVEQVSKTAWDEWCKIYRDFE